MSQSRCHYIASELEVFDHPLSEVVLDLSMWLDWILLLPRPSPDGGARSQRSCFPASVHFASPVP